MTSSPSPSPKLELADLRENYTQAGLIESDLAADPWRQFTQWFQEALGANLIEPNAMTLATVTPEGKPTARIVLLKELDDRGFIFFTNYTSRKAQDLASNPWAALVFLWTALERQVRIEGQVEKIADSETDAYFQTRPRGSQLGAWVSPQSQVISDRQYLEDELDRLTQQYRNQAIPRPPHWGGYRVIPNRIEFWQGRPNRLHDRLCYQIKAEGGWTVERLAP
ncbi:pyridoxamine 5'-phosphate oxidase [Lyngbya confervoides]|uniref:Pyridoxine/pyridoxamine 5'-phosphate oxidase n=1 Tax=Lyngbya confervoides BDU141951 TaxID=1574623 RepID=A0ABD4T4G9_9CYAN|nr:pyridoxamine 5'-phosphate oxidase [Lyngbya confervoides]MCM1983422.1 pyridoxamine 5'-phosphate oxidase [Lyngbya confervoides BDU141951]